MLAGLLLIGTTPGCSLEQLQDEAASLRAEAQEVIADVHASGIALSPGASSRLEWIDARIAEIDDKIQGAETGFDLVDAVGGLAAGALGLGAPWALFSRIARRKLAEKQRTLARATKVGSEAINTIVGMARSVDLAKQPSADDTDEESPTIMLDRKALIDTQAAMRIDLIVKAAREGDEGRLIRLLAAKHLPLDD